MLWKSILGLRRFYNRDRIQILVSYCDMRGCFLATANVFKNILYNNIMCIINRIIYLNLFLVICVTGMAQSLQSKIEQLTGVAFYRHANIGVSVRDVNDRHLIAEVRKDKVLVPASALKLVTTLTGLELLGGDFRFSTRITYDGRLGADGILKGNIYIEGGGDPSLGSERIPGVEDADRLIRRMTDDILKAGIKCIEGNIIADESVFNSFPVSPSWQWNDLGNYYAAGAWGLNINENLYNIWYNRSGPVGSLSRIAYFEPRVPNLVLENEVTIDSANTSDNAYIFGGPYHYGKRVVGTIPQGKDLYKVKGSLPDPPLFFAYKLLTQLDKRNMGGHNYRTQYRAVKNKQRRILISEYRSPDLKTIVRYTNDLSINIYAESILKTMGLVMRKSGSGTEGIGAIKSFMKKQGLDTEPLNMEDGSGLSARNLMSPDLMASFLATVAKNKDLADLRQIIPAAGERGTVRNLLVRSPAKGRIWLKSGSMDNILTYAGYCKAASGRLVSFAVFLNGSTTDKPDKNKAELEKILDAIYRFS